MSPLVIVVLVLLVAVAVLLVLLLWALDHIRAAWPYSSQTMSRRQRRAWRKERLDLGQAKTRAPYARMTARGDRK